MGDNLRPVDLGTGRTAKQISFGDFFMCIILSDNNLACIGKNDYGQLGIGSTVRAGRV